MRNLFGWYALGVGVGGLGGFMLATLEVPCPEAGWKLLSALVLFNVLGARSLGPTFSEHLHACTGHWHLRLLDLPVVAVLVGFALAYLESMRALEATSVALCLIGAGALLLGLLFASQYGLEEGPLRYLYAAAVVARVASVIWTAGYLVFNMTTPYWFYGRKYTSVSNFYKGVIVFAASLLVLAFVERMRLAPARATWADDGRFHARKGVTRRRLSG
ncbi:MAG: hypothetical protein KIS92_23075 [Planctomycetota bacterium]|nr:hypothetical protein [Planctomycetota bacterium]